MKTYTNLTVITGASQGLGKAFAANCASRGRDLILISLPGEHLPETAMELMERYKIQVLFFETDLTKIENMHLIIQKLSKYEINMLINNAGIGGAKKFNEASPEYLENMIFLNMRCLVMLTQQLIPYFKKGSQNYILNISSLAAFSPLPYKTIYPASKAFVLSFSRSLYAELKGTNIHLAVACPGGIATNLDVIKRINNHKGVLRKSILMPEVAASICMEKLFKKKSVIIPGRLNKLSSILQRIIPVGLQLKIVGNKLQKELIPVS